MTTVSGMVFNIQHFSIHDGPGIRTTVFLKGCPLRCPWCANPESQSMKAEKTLTSDGKCYETIGQIMTVDQIIEEVLKDQDFYEESGGGITLSGGEIFAQFDFALAILKAAKEVGLHTAIETTAYTKTQQFAELVEYVDFIYTDLKHYNQIKHRQMTGVANNLIIKNIHHAFQKKKEMVLRIPVIPDFNDSLEDAKAFSQLFKSLDITQVQLLPFHQFGENKYKLLGRDYQMADIKAYHPEELKDYQDVFLDHQIHCYF
ncbi:glycyl-radical enzyme activating protein [Streptococcus iniae]|uniref:glycyl-radical enzyme activating protein n=1 Tax=Streptococcus iniae TaxID=1346 RepID=UPI0003348028|nr:glycyl-radical enzyme activating protein [Streptococcus iniae]AGM97994.1 glycyl-radical enzyme activating protein family protein [Streptococcus iniae SF1]APD31132.1 pyruvate formate lyase-activating protein [Streptococcus iniae]AYB02064.1 glycyl-radical enzyme activating protein [Streptococcus iniae]AYB03931.1 glycyl-radical enzyme activating protein [Streptococcus iniae]OAS95765.1 pyruvate formate lyase-activating protein [Streptococcus iniae]